jgi:murein DD-endopeptidase MepM/ murein hydrolase activator NlpD
VSEASAEEAGLLDRLDEIQARRRRLDAKVAAVDAQLAAVQHDVDAAESRLEAVQGEFVRAQTRLALTTDELAAARNKLRRRAVSAYVGGGPSGAADLVLRAGSLRQVAASVGYLQSLVAIDRQSVARYGTLRDATAHLRVPAEAAKDAAKAQRDVVIDRQAALQAVRADHDAVRQDVLAQEDGQQLLIAEVRSRRNEFEAQIAALGVESGSVASLLRGIQGGQTPVVAGSGVLVAPIPGARITSGFGPRVHPILGTVRMHDGIDYAAAMGTPIRAAGSGTVVSAGPRGGYGNATLVDHGRGLATLVAHQSAMYVTAGTAVVTGQVIGAVGSTGFSTGPHLHFEVRVEGTPVDPLLYL